MYRECIMVVPQQTTELRVHAILKEHQGTAEEVVEPDYHLMG